MGFRKIDKIEDYELAFKKQDLKILDQAEEIERLKNENKSQKLKLYQLTEITKPYIFIQEGSISDFDKELLQNSFNVICYIGVNAPRIQEVKINAIAN